MVVVLGLAVIKTWLAHNDSLRSHTDLVHGFSLFGYPPGWAALTCWKRWSKIL
jgi:hypothetical protein